MEIIKKQGYLLMLAGMGILIVGVYIFIRIYRGANDSPTFAWTITSIGLALYITGRIGVAIKSRRRK